MTPQETSLLHALRLAGDLVHPEAPLAARELASDESGSGTGSSGTRASAPRATRFVMRSGDRITVVRVQEVDSIEADGNYVRIHVKQNTYRFRVTIRALAASLDPAQFVRIHKSTIVNLDSVREIQTWFGGDYVAILSDGRQLRVSRTYARELLRPIR